MAAEVSVSINMQLKKLRTSAVPKLSIRAMAEALGIGHSRYAYFEDPSRFKKRELPLDLARQIAAVLSERGVDPGEVLRLAGLTAEEAEPETRAIESAKPPLQFVSMPVALPSEAALHDMFRSILVLVPEGASKDEAAAILARRLAAGLASIGPLALDFGSAASPAAGEAPPAPSKDRPASAPSSHT